MFNGEPSISIEHMQKQVYGFRFSRRHQLTEVFIELETSDQIIVTKTFMKFSMKNLWQEFVQPIKLRSCA